MSEQTEMTTSQNPIANRYFLWEGSLTMPFTLLCLTPNLLIEHCYISTAPMTVLKNRIQCVLRGTKSIMKFFSEVSRSSFVFLPTEAHKNLTQLLEGIISIAGTRPVPEVFISIPLLAQEKDVQPVNIMHHTARASISLKSHLYGSLFYALMSTQGSPAPLCSQSLGMFVDLTNFAPPFELYLKGEHVNACDYCPLHKDKIGSICIYYTPNYECVFSHSINPIHDSLMLSAALSKAEGIEDKFLEFINTKGLVSGYDTRFDAYWEKMEKHKELEEHKEVKEDASKEEPSHEAI